MLDLSSLNDRQQEAVTAPLGPVLVLAGAGSGKTRVLAYRIAYIVDQGLVNAGNILALTFTNKAAKEMQSRVKALLSSKSQVVSGKVTAETHSSSLTSHVSSGLPTMGTFHSVGARLLRKEISALGYTSSFIIFDTDDTLKVIKEICQELAISARYSPSLFRSFISSAKNLLQTPDTFNIGLDEPLHSLAQSVYARYQNYLFKQNAVDFDDLLLLPIKIFEVKPEILAKYQALFAYILVDEYQDTNPAQYKFLQLLAPNGSLFVVGDDAQSIYGFRGSDIRNILNFEKDYPKVLVVPLEQNYRSTKNILAVASKVIALNPEQKSKELWTENDAGEKIRVDEVDNEVAEAELVARTIIRRATGEEEPEEILEEPDDKPFSILDQFIKKAGRTSSFSLFSKLPPVHDPLSEYAVLYRTHAQSRALEEVFITAGIPYQIVGGIKFYERKEIKDVLAYLRLVVNFKDLVSVKRVINSPARGIGEKSYQIVKEFILAHADSADIDIGHFNRKLENIPLPSKQQQGVRTFFELLESAGNYDSNAALPVLVNWLIKKIGLEKYFRDGTEVGETRWENVEELVSVASNFSHLPWREGLQNFLEEVSLFTDIDTVEDEKDAVTFMTLHSAKGLEFDTVFFVGLEEGILPHSRSLIDPKELAEEIRLAYVGLTRARKRLYLTHARTRTVFGNTQAGVPSRILQVLPDQIIEYRGGGKTSGHPSFNTNGVTYETMDF